LTSSFNVKKIAITLGEPAGIGTELITSLALKQQLTNCIVIGDQSLLLQQIKKQQLPLSINEAKENCYQIDCHHIPLKVEAQLGQLNVKNAAYVLDLLNHTARGCLDGTYAAMVTCPIHKGIINDSGLVFTGHTEYLAQLSGTKDVVMMLLNQYMRVALATTHIPLKEVSQSITRDKLKTVLDILIDDMRTKFGIHAPKIAVCGLNPHAGEDGHLGMEEIEIINPLIKEYQTNGYQVSGSIPADTLFTKDKLENYDVVLAMYHDQGLTPLKYAGFGKSVNVTLGLPFIRASVDHGTALDIAGKNLASSDSLLEAINLTRELVSHG
jgi:4-hydroxythreonine-4-phosphate dehydrogenase